MAEQTRSGSRACARYEALLEDYLEGNLEGEAVPRVKRHLQSCPGCAAAFQAAEETILLLQTARQPARLDPAFRARVMSSLRAEAEGQTGGGIFCRPLEILSWRFALSAALALALLTSYMAWESPLWKPAPVAVQAEESKDIFPEPVQQPNSGDDVLLAIAETRHGK